MSNGTAAQEKRRNVYVVRLAAKNLPERRVIDITMFNSHNETPEGTKLLIK